MMDDVAKLVTDYFGVVRKYVRIFGPRLKDHGQRQQMESFAAETLWRAAKAYRPEWGSFINFASLRVRGACVDFLRNANGYRLKRERPQFIGLNRTLAVHDRQDDRSDWWERVTAGLDDVSRAVIGLLRNECNQSAISRVLGCSERNVGLLRDKAFNKIRLAAVSL